MRRTFFLFSLIGMALSGCGVVIVLTLGGRSLWPLVGAIGIGTVAALPISSLLLVTRDLG